MAKKQDMYKIKDGKRVKMKAAEVAAIEAAQAEMAAKREAEAEARAAKQSLCDSARTKLIDLGLTAEELNALGL